MGFIDGKQCKEILENRTQAEWTVADSNPDFIKLVYDSFRVIVEYEESSYRFKFDDLSDKNSNKMKLGPIRRDAKVEFKAFVDSIQKYL